VRRRRRRREEGGGPGGVDHGGDDGHVLLLLGSEPSGHSGGVLAEHDAGGGIQGLSVGESLPELLGDEGH
jgi:hypothetical protein